MNGDVQYTITGTHPPDIPWPVTVAIDRLAAELHHYAGWAIRVDIDPGIVITATPARDTAPPERPSEAPQSDEDGEDG